MKEYTERNTRLRTAATNVFEKYFFKLMHNSVFAKTMEDVRKHIDVKLVTDCKKQNRLMGKPNLNRDVIFDENLVAVHMKKTKAVYKKPIYLAMCIVDAVSPKRRPPRVR